MSVVPTQDLKPWFQTFEDLGGPIVWSSFFGNGNSVELDIGCGRGLFLVNASASTPDTNFLGMELDFKKGRHAARRLQKRESSNGRVLGGDCRIALESLIPPGSVAAAHVYFPDPWWKRRHKRRRLFTTEFADLLAQVLQPDGLVHSWTDVPDYFQVISTLMKNHPRFTFLPPPEERDPSHDMDYHTSFERKKRKEGLTIWRGRWQLKPAD